MESKRMWRSSGSVAMLHSRICRVAPLEQLGLEVLYRTNNSRYPNVLELLSIPPTIHLMRSSKSTRSQHRLISNKNSPLHRNFQQSKWLLKSKPNERSNNFTNKS